MMYPLRDRILGPVLAFSLALGLKPVLAEDAAALGRALAHSSQRDWAQAQMQAASSGPLALALIQWQRLRAGQGDWPEYLAFARAHRDWPGMELFYRRGDALLRPGLAPADVLDWFGDRRPTTLNAAQVLTTTVPTTTEITSALSANRKPRAKRCWLSSSELDIGDSCSD